jgi:hypothetical protein
VRDDEDGPAFRRRWQPGSRASRTTDEERSPFLCRDTFRPGIVTGRSELVLKLSVPPLSETATVPC